VMSLRWANVYNLARAKDVPSFSALRKCQDKLWSAMDIKMTQFESPLQNVFYVNDIEALIAKNYANPLTAPFLVHYPHISDTTSEVWHGEKLNKELPLHQLCPHYIDPSGNFFHIDEFAHLCDGQIRDDGNLWADAYLIVGHQNADGLICHTILDQHMTEIAATAFVTNYLDLCKNGHVPRCNARSLYGVKHIRKLIKILDQTLKYICYSCKLTLLTLAAGHLYADNPMHSKKCGHIGDNGLHDCRKCHCSGPESFKVSNDGYNSLFSPQQPRYSAETLSEVKAQVLLACKGNATQVTKCQTDTGVKDPYTQHWINDILSHFQQLKCLHPSCSDEDITKALETFVREHDCNLYNPFLQIEGFDINHDTPLSFFTQFYSVSSSTLGTWYICLYSSNNWINSSSSFSLALLTVFQLHPFAQIIFSSIGIHLSADSLSKSCNQVCFISMDCSMTFISLCGKRQDAFQYMFMVYSLANVKIAIDNVLDIFALIDPLKIWSKIKLHILSHVHEDISQFGPIIGQSMKVFECYNAIFRFCTILMNGCSSSHDIAIQLADQEVLKQHVTGGMWPQFDGEWVQASVHVRSMLEYHKILQNHLSWSINKPAEPVPKHCREELKWSQMQAVKTVNCPEHDSQSIWLPGEKVIARPGDVCKIGSWVFALLPLTFETSPIYKMPVLGLCEGEHNLVTVDSKEWENTGLHTQCIEHKHIKRYIINTHALHNAHLLREVLPHSLTTPMPYLLHRHQKHDEMASNL
ncbi:hypothetical protein A0H81_09161, partial [Grifola frondosa]